MNIDFQNLRRAVFVVTAIATVTGCAGKFDVETKEKVRASTADLNSGIAKIEQRKEVPLFQRVPGLWISDRVVSQSASQRLPAIFNQKFILREQSLLTLSDIGDAVRASTGLNVSLQGDALGLSTMRFAIDHVGTLQSLLDSTAARTGVAWAWEDNTIVIQQSVAKTFPVRRAGIEAVKAAAASNGGGAASAATASLDPFAELALAINVISPSARTSVLKAASAITVNDTPAGVKRIADLLEFDDRQSSKQVTLLWRLINFTANNNAEAGVDLQALLTKASGVLAFGSPATLAGINNGAIRLQSTAGTDKGSSIALTVLNEVGTAYIAKSGVATLKNNSRDDISNEKEIFYLSKTTPGPASSNSGGAGSIGIEQSSVKVGLSGAFGVSIYDSERMDLSFDFSVAFLDQLKLVESAGQKLQSPEVSRRSGKGVVPIKHGETWILTSQSSDGFNYDRRGLFENSIVGGSDRGSSSKEQWMLVVTPIITQKGI